MASAITMPIASRSESTWKTARERPCVTIAPVTRSIPVYSILATSNPPPANPMNNQHTPDKMAVRSASLRNLAVNQSCNQDVLHDAADMLYDASLERNESEKLKSILGETRTLLLNQSIAFNQMVAQRNALLVALQAIDKLSCNGPCMSLQAEHEFARSSDAHAYKLALCGLVLEMRQQARNAIALARGGDK